VTFLSSRSSSTQRILTLGQVCQKESMPVLGGGWLRPVLSLKKEDLGHGLTLLDCACTVALQGIQQSMSQIWRWLAAE